MKERTKRGELTAYALACGYQDGRISDDYVIYLWCENSCYFVVFSGKAEYAKFGTSKLGEARALFRMQPKTILDPICHRKFGVPDAT